MQGIIHWRNILWSNLECVCAFGGVYSMVLGGLGYPISIIKIYWDPTLSELDPPLTIGLAWLAPAGNGFCVYHWKLVFVCGSWLQDWLQHCNNLHQPWNLFYWKLDSRLLLLHEVEHCRVLRTIDPVLGEQVNLSSRKKFPRGNLGTATCIFCETCGQDTDGVMITESLIVM